MVDDERVIADTLSIILNQNGFEASAVYSGTSAVDRAREMKPELVISDVIMQDMNGIEAAIKIRELLPACKSFSSPARPPRPIFWRKPARRGTSLKSSPSLSIRRTCWRS